MSHVESIARALLLPACLVLLCPAGGCRPAGDADATAGNDPSLFAVPAAQRAHLQLVTVTRSPVTLPVLVPARVNFNELKTSHVVALVSGRVAKVLVHEGDRVKAEQPLLSIASPDASDVQANLARDQSALATKQVILARDRDLYEHKAISLEELQQAELDVTATKATLQDDKSHAYITGGDTSHAVLRAPIAGIVVARNISVGEAVQAGTTPCFTITDPTQAWVIAQLYQQDLRQVALGNTALIRSPVLSAPLHGTVTYIGSSIDPDALTIPVRIAAENPDGLLKQGMYVDAEIIPDKAEPMIVLPAAAVLRDADNLPFVYVEVAAGSFARRHVTLGPEVHGDFAVAAGLTPGEKVLGAGALFVQFADSLEH